jgi:hypothetical protein
MKEFLQNVLMVAEIDCGSDESGLTSIFHVPIEGN